MKKMYVTYRWREIGGYTQRYAIECPTEQDMIDCAYDLSSLCGIFRVQMNRGGRINKQTQVISFEDYKNGSYYNM